MAVSAVLGSACRSGPSDNGYIYSMCIAYVPIAAKAVNKQMLSIKQWESRIIIFDRWTGMTGLKRLPHSFMQIAFPTAWISASVRRLEAWKGGFPWLFSTDSTSARSRPWEESDAGVRRPHITQQEQAVNNSPLPHADPTGRRCKRRVGLSTQRDGSEPCTSQAAPAGARSLPRTWHEVCQALWDRSDAQQRLRD